MPDRQQSAIQAESRPKSAIPGRIAQPAERILKRQFKKIEAASSLGTALLADALEEGRVGQPQSFGCFKPPPAELIEHVPSVALLQL